MGSEQPQRPEFDLFDRQSAFDIDLRILRERTLSAFPICLSSPGQGPRPLAALPAVEISFVDDAEISRIHEEFMDIPGATDVITFDHGEIVISTETAARYAAEFGNPFHDELSLYIIHGLLHLNGHEDTTGEGFGRMRQIQARILAAVVAG